MYKVFFNIVMWVWKVWHPKKGDLALKSHHSVRVIVITVITSLQPRGAVSQQPIAHILYEMWNWTSKTFSSKVNSDVAVALWQSTHTEKKIKKINKNPTWQTGKSLSCTIQYPNCTSDKVLVSEYRLPFWRKKSSENNRIFGSDSFRLSYNLSLCHEPLGPVLSHLLISANHFCDYAALHAKIFPVDPIMNSFIKVPNPTDVKISHLCDMWEPS